MLPRQEVLVSQDWHPLSRSPVVREAGFIFLILILCLYYNSSYPHDSQKVNIAIGLVSAAWLSSLVAGGFGIFLLGITPFVLALSTSCTQVNKCGQITGSIFSIVLSILCCIAAVGLANAIQTCDDEIEEMNGGDDLFASSAAADDDFSANFHSFMSQNKDQCDAMNGAVALLWVSAVFWLGGGVASMLVGPPNSSGYDTSGVAVVEMADAKVVHAESA